MRHLSSTRGRLQNPKCIVCGRMGEYHHLLTQKTYPELKDEVWNKLPVCREHHTEAHKKALTWMAKTYSKVAMWLKQMGWEHDGTKYRPKTYKKESI